MTTTPTTIGALLQHHWKPGMPADVCQKAGSFWKMLAKAVSTGWTGKGAEHAPIDSALPANVGLADYGTAFANSSGRGAEEWVITLAQAWAVMKLNWLVHELTRDEAQKYIRDTLIESKKYLRAWHRGMSWKVWGNGGGAAAKGDGAYSVGGDTVKFLNKHCARRFEVNDFVKLADTDGRTTPTVRPGRGKVTAVDEQAGTIKLNGNVSDLFGAGAVNTDFIFLEGDLQTGDVITGMFAWIEPNSANLATGSALKTLFGVNREFRPDRLGGRRVNVPQKKSPFNQIVEILQVAIEVGAPIDCIYYPTSVATRLVKEIEGKAIYKVEPVKIQGSAKNYTMGVTALQMVYPGHDVPVKLVADRYLTDIEVTAANDNRMLGVCMDEIAIDATKTGISWKDYTGQGQLQEIAGSQNMYAKYGMHGQLVVNGPGNHIVCGTSVTE